MFPSEKKGYYATTTLGSIFVHGCDPCTERTAEPWVPTLLLATGVICGTLVCWALKRLEGEFSISNLRLLLPILNYWAGYGHNTVTDAHWEISTGKLRNRENEDTRRSDVDLGRRGEITCHGRSSVQTK